MPSRVPNWHALHYNAIAKEIRELYPERRDDEEEIDRWRIQGQYGVLTTLAINLAKRFQKDNPNFDPLRFLDACSPNAMLYPLSELWNDDAD